MNNTELIARLRLGASISRERKLNQGYDVVADEAADAIEALAAELKYAKAERDALQAQLAAAQTEVESQRSYKDGAYLERNRLVALLSKVFPSGKKKTAIEGWSEDWHGCVYIDLPTGQASWHYHDSQAWLFEHLPEYQGAWDGHTTDEKYERIQRHAAPIPQQVAQQAQPERGPSDDTARLNWLEAQGFPGLGWVARDSTTGRGYRLHQDSAGHVLVRDAIDAAIKQGCQHD